ncbi:MAG: hypothetical protein IPJ81_14140 [Chitinophagaceae bacterium]|nr:hypothetical protein [Chitinophagaceae bacterium]
MKLFFKPVVVIIFTSCTLLPVTIFAQEKWYTPVNIGEHIYIDSGLVKEEQLSAS